MFAAYQTFAYTFSSRNPAAAESFKPTGGSFDDHDDSNMIWSAPTAAWVDMQSNDPPGTKPHRPSRA